MQAQPTKLKALKGTLEKSRLVPNEVEFISITKIPDPPKYFDKIAKEEWKRATKILSAVGMLSEADIPQLKVYCNLISAIENAAEKLAEYGMVGKLKNSAGHDYQAKNKWWSIYLEAVDRLVKLGHEFGFSPSSRSKISMPSKNKNEGYYFD